MVLVSLGPPGVPTRAGGCPEPQTHERCRAVRKLLQVLSIAHMTSRHSGALELDSHGIVDLVICGGMQGTILFYR